MLKESVNDSQKEILKEVACYLIDKLPENPLGNFEPKFMSLEIDFIDTTHKGLKTSTRFPELIKRLEGKFGWDYATELNSQGS